MEPALSGVEETVVAEEAPAESKPGALALILTPDGRIVLQLRDDAPDIRWPGHWSLPGGGQEAGETPRDTILREIREETGITPDTLREVTVTPHDVRKTPPHVFVGTWSGREADLVLGEGQELRLFPVAELPTPMPPHVRHYIRHLTRAD
ncbi:NUDIX domain-containing protein [Streptomyces avicenniae]|uniref:NUDIX domain-containing protein n=1 Tax=Streptomyces avicenniae TaxID=500153 RepID=UPI000AA6497C|nr:NUDIX domain-containing protein [Streptomyces avicenniae]